MASIRPKPSGRWEARYRDARGRLHARTFPTKTAARRWAADMESDVRRGTWVDPKLARTTFGEWALEFLGAIVHLRAVTRADYERALRTLKNADPRPRPIRPASSTLPPDRTCASSR